MNSIPLSVLTAIHLESFCNQINQNKKDAIHLLQLPHYIYPHTKLLHVDWRCICINA